MPRQYEFTVALQDTDITSKIKFVALIDKILAAAGFDADKLGFGVEELNTEYCTWVLSRLAVQTQRMPRLGEKFIINTWVSSYGRVLTIRNFTIFTPAGERIAAAVSAWAIIDIRQRKPMDLSHAEAAATHTENIPSPIDEPRRVKATEIPSAGEHRAVYSDIDFNGHVGTMRYVEMMIDTMPEQSIERMESARFDINFLHETKLGQTIGIRFGTMGNKHSFGLSVNAEDICRAELDLL